MSEQIKTGGPALPRPGIPTNWTATKQDGMTLRDYFAGKAMQGFTSNQDWMITASRSDNRYRSLSEIIPAAAYEIADAMIKERGEQ